MCVCTVIRNMDMTKYSECVYMYVFFNNHFHKHPHNEASHNTVIRNMDMAKYSESKYICTFHHQEFPRPLSVP